MAEARAAAWERWSLRLRGLLRLVVVGGDRPYPDSFEYSTLEPVGRRGGHLTEVSFADAKTLNPMLSNDTVSGAMAAMVFNTLVTLNPDTALPFPDLATEVPTKENGGISADGLTYTFHLRKDVKWHDGQPFTSKDVVFTYQTMAKKELNSPNTSRLIERVASVTATDDHTVVFKMKKVVAPFLVSNMYGIVPEHILGSVPVDQIKQHPFSTGDPKQTVGTGPFMFKEWVKGDHITLIKNPVYFLGTPALDQYIYKLVKDDNAVAARLKAGEADVGGVSAAQYQGMTRQPNLNVLTYFNFGFDYYGYNLDPTKTTLFQQREIRQALAYALDREAIARAVGIEPSQVAVGTMPPLSWAYAPDQIEYTYPYDPKKANRLLDEAGWARGPDGIRTRDGQRLALTIWTSPGTTQRERFATMMQQMWKAVGIDATPKIEAWDAFLARITETHDFDIFLVALSWSIDPDQTAMWACGSYPGGFNCVKYCNPRVDDLLAKGLSTLDQARRKQIYIEMQNLVLEDLPALVMNFRTASIALNKRVHNLKPNAINVRWNAHTWWVTDGK